MGVCHSRYIENSQIHIPVEPPASTSSTIDDNVAHLGMFPHSGIKFKLGPKKQPVPFAFERCEEEETFETFFTRDLFKKTLYGGLHSEYFLRSIIDTLSDNPVVLGIDFFKWSDEAVREDANIVIGRIRILQCADMDVYYLLTLIYL